MTGPSESTDIYESAWCDGCSNHGRTEDIIEQFTAVFVRVESIVDVGLETRVDVTIVEFAVEDEEDRVCESL